MSIGVTEQQCDVVAMVMIGMSMDEIAKARSVSYSGVKSLLCEVYKRVGVECRANLILYCIRIMYPEFKVICYIPGSVKRLIDTSKDLPRGNDGK